MDSATRIALGAASVGDPETQARPCDARYANAAGARSDERVPHGSRVHLEQSYHSNTESGGKPTSLAPASIVDVSQPRCPAVLWSASDIRRNDGPRQTFYVSARTRYGWWMPPFACGLAPRLRPFAEVEAGQIIQPGCRIRDSHRGKERTAGTIRFRSGGEPQAHRRASGAPWGYSS